VHGPPAPRCVCQQAREQLVRAAAPTGPVVNPRAVAERAAPHASEGVVEPDRAAVEQRRLPGDVRAGHAIDGTPQKRTQPRAAPGGRRARLAAVGMRLLSLLRHEDVIAKARRHATEIVAADPGLQRHPGLHALVAETVGDEERAAYLDKV
jgi:hypothetical protein